MHIRVASRKSPLALKQVEEIFRGLPHLTYSLTAIDTMGDLDKLTSLRTLEKTDFFTRELDALLLAGAADIAIHSAKDLPDPLPQGLEVIALTACIDPRDSLVFKTMLPENPLVATSSKRREEAVLELIKKARFCDIRGTISERLEALGKDVDAVVIAEAALIRLNLTHLSRFYLPGETAACKGQLAVVARTDHQILHPLFSPIDVRSLHRA